MKKSLSLLMVVILILLAGCSGSSKDDKATKQTPANEKAAEDEAVTEEAAADEEAAKEEVSEEAAVTEEAAKEETVQEEAAQEEAADDDMQESDVVGIRMDLSAVSENLKGTLLENPIGAFDDGRHIYVMPIYYIGMPKDEASELLYKSDPSEEETQKLNSFKAIVHIIVATEVDYDTTVKSLSEILGFDFTEEMSGATEIGTADGFTFYSIPERDEDKLSTFGEEYLAEYNKLQEELLDVEKSATLFAPVDPAKEMIGQKLEFTTTDLDGNTVTSQELFSANEITLVNCWGTWCGNCMREMAELEEIHKRIQEKGCGFVGLEYEGYWAEETEQKSRDAIAQYGITYPNVRIPEELPEQLLGFPTTFYVDKEGTILCTPLVGAYVNKYEPILDSLLQGNTVVDNPVNDSTDVIEENQDVVYNVYVTDENGPVKVVTIQFCSADCCKMGKTDDNGVASFSMPSGDIYDVHVLRVPEGYEKDPTVYHTTNDSSDVQIQLKKK